MTGMAEAAPTFAHYAHEAFPWAGIDQSVTIRGFLDHRYSSYRQSWGRVISADDARLANGLVILVAREMRAFAITGEILQAFCLAEVKSGRVNALADVAYGGVTHESGEVRRAISFRDGWLAGQR